MALGLASLKPVALKVGETGAKDEDLQICTMYRLLIKIYRNYMVVSTNGGTPKSSILIGVSIINHPFWGTTIFGNPHIESLIITLLEATCHIGAARKLCQKETSFFQASVFRCYVVGRVSFPAASQTRLIKVSMVTFS